jgi:hypothetical protein
MFEEDDKLKPIVAAIAGPFATASAALLFALALAEYFRRGFVSLFLDFRIVCAIVLVLWAIAVWSEEPIRRKWFGIVTIGLVVLVAALVLWPMLAPWGRLGLIVFVAGLAAFAMVFLSSIRKPDSNP